MIREMPWLFVPTIETWVGSFLGNVSGRVSTVDIESQQSKTNISESRGEGSPSRQQSLYLYLALRGVAQPEVTFPAIVFDPEVSDSITGAGNLPGSQRSGQ